MEAAPAHHPDSPKVAARRDDVVSVVVAVRNGKGTIGSCLESLVACAKPTGLDVEIIVVDDGSTDGTPDVVAGFPDVGLLRQEPSGPSAARNLGIRSSSGEAIAFTDADCEVDESWLIELVNTLRSTAAGAAGGAQLLPSGSTGLARHVGAFLQAVGFCGGYTKLGDTVREVAHNPSCNSIYRRAVLDEVGGFSENLWPGEDVELDLRVAKKGYRIVYNPRARVHHHRTGSLRGFARMMARYGCWSSGYLTRHYGIYRPLSLAPLLFLLLGASLWGATVLSPVLGLMLTLVVLAAPAVLFRRAGAPVGSLPVLYLLAAVGAVAWNLGFLRGLFISPPPRPGLASPQPSIA